MKRVFIANRGEIARRIASTAKLMGMESIVPVSSGLPDYLKPFAIGVKVDRYSRDFFLDINGVLKVAKDCHCDAVHPGFGFLSESQEFAKAVKSSGMIWIGPNPEAISKMADKGTARSIAKQLGLPTLGGLDAINPAQEKDIRGWIANNKKSLNFPLIIKAVMGGGGKGMRVVREYDQLEAAIQRASSEALASFGDGRILLETFLEFPRHVEVQIFGDSKGNITTLGDRDCSVQRRHQKIIEECPAPLLTKATRDRMARAAIQLAKEVSYDSAGTVEFLVDWHPSKQGLENQDFYFLEMNTRLQVEHPVTEEVYGTDLVEYQFRAARGEDLSNDFDGLTPRHHSIEVRLYAEDPHNSFFPAPGPVNGFFPYQDASLRWEIGIDTVDEISSDFDPMIAKLVSTGVDRNDAVRKLLEGLRNTAVFTNNTNQAYLMEILKDQDFRNLAVTNRYLDESHDRLCARIQKAQEFNSASAERLTEFLKRNDSLSPFTVRQESDRFSNTVETTYSSSDRLSDAYDFFPSISSRQGNAGNCFLVRSGRATSKDNPERSSFYYSFVSGTDKLEIWTAINGLNFVSESKLAFWNKASSKSARSESEILAPVPGKVVKIDCKTGDKVASSAVLFVLESMKMEFEVKPVKGGSIKRVLVQEGQQVEPNEVLAEFNVD